MKMRSDYMRIKWIEFKNLETGLTIERIDFFDDVTLLVGLSGVGKTQILNAISYSLALAIHENVKLRPVSATLGIKINNDIFEWSYKITKNVGNDILIDADNEFGFSEEMLKRNEEIVFERNNTNVLFSGYDKVPNPKKNESLLLQYSENEELSELIQGIRKLYSVEMDFEVRGGIKSEFFNNMKSRINSLMNENDVNNSKDFNKFSHLPVILKVYIIKKYYENIYIKIFEAIKELFVEIEDIDVIEDETREIYWLTMTVYGTKMTQREISNGMLKSIYYIVELFTMAEDSLVMIDEFENGLGVNCIDLLSELLLYTRNDLQFIITSHHPKIINSIAMEKWKIIDREIRTVKNSNCKEYEIGNSQHNSYFNLINRWEFEGKI